MTRDLQEREADEEKRLSLSRIVDVLERWPITGINRKIQLKPKKWVVVDGRTVRHPANIPAILESSCQVTASPSWLACPELPATRCLSPFSPLPAGGDQGKSGGEVGWRGDDGRGAWGEATRRVVPRELVPIRRSGGRPPQASLHIPPRSAVVSLEARHGEADWRDHTLARYGQKCSSKIPKKNNRTLARTYARTRTRTRAHARTGTPRTKAAYK